MKRCLFDIRAASLADVQAKGSLLVHLDKQAIAKRCCFQQIALFYSDNQVYALDNRCPHMGFPLHGSTCKDGIVTCPWHYARFDLNSGGTFDSWADDVRSFPVEIPDFSRDVERGDWFAALRREPTTYI